MVLSVPPLGIFDFFWVSNLVHQGAVWQAIRTLNRTHGQSCNKKDP